MCNELTYEECENRNIAMWKGEKAWCYSGGVVVVEGSRKRVGWSVYIRNVPCTMCCYRECESENQARSFARHLAHFSQAGAEVLFGQAYRLNFINEA